MKGKVLCLIALISLSLAMTDKEIIQNGLNGLFEQSKLPDPKTIVPCIDDVSAHDIVVFFGQLVSKAANGTFSDFISLHQFILDFKDKLEPKVKKCLTKNPEFKALAVAYKVQDDDFNTLDRKVWSYFVLHYLTVRKWFIDLDDHWRVGNYYQVGYDAGKYLNKVFGVGELELSDKEIIQQVLNGIFEHKKLPDPKTIVSCMDDQDSRKLTLFMGQIIHSASRSSVEDLMHLPQLTKEFYRSLKPQIRTCLRKNRELHALAVAFKIDKMEIQEFDKRVISYFRAHYDLVHKWFIALDDHWRAKNYERVGSDLGLILERIIIREDDDEEVSLEDLQVLPPREMLQRALNGIFEENRLDDSKTILKCMDDRSILKVNYFISRTITRIIDNPFEVTLLPQEIRDFFKTIDPSIRKCLRDNEDLRKLADAYKVRDMSPKEIEKRFIDYSSEHFLTMHKWVIQYDRDWHNGNYYQFGFHFGGNMHEVFGPREEEEETLILSLRLEY